jgi:hypothetical protein
MFQYYLDIPKNIAAILRIALVAIIGLTIPACKDPINNDNPPPPTLSGTVSIIGTAQVGGTLTANTDSLGGSGTISYQWKRASTNGGTITNIGTNSSTYIVQSADEGYTITVTVTRSGNSGSVSSTPTATVTQPTSHDTSLAAQLAWLQANAQSNSSYSLEVNADEDIAPHTLSYSGRSDITITLKGIGTNRIIGLSSNGSLFTIESSITLILDSNITLQGRSSNNSSLVLINSGGRLVMNTGARISGNTISLGSGGGVYVDGGTFTMNGGIISDNVAPYGGGIYIIYGTFTMNSGVISDNEASSGGGVNMINGTITMNGGEISGNKSTASVGAGAGGVSVAAGTFTMYGGIISGNSANTNGGGMVVSDSSTVFRIVTGTIYGSNESDTSLRNTANTGAALYRAFTTVEYGTFSGETWNRNGTLDTRNDTIRVVSGVLQ